jgi:signal transduction histidine kinase
VVHGLPLAIPPLNWILARTKSGGAAEFMRGADGRWWFCRIERLSGGDRGYLLFAQELKGLSGNQHRRITPSLLTNIGFLLAGTIGILLLTRSYVTQLLAEMHQQVKSLCGSEGSEGIPNDGKAEFVSDELEWLNELLAEVRSRLLQGSERKWQMERRKLHADKLATIATLTSAFAHQVGTPLGVIRGLTEMLLTGTFEQSEIPENLEAIIAQSDQISRTVKLLLDIGRIRSAIRVTSDVRAIAERTIQLLKPEAARRGVEVIAQLGCRPLMVDCDPDQLQQVFANLEANAFDAMGQSGGKLQVNSVADEVQGIIRISFEDTGPGVPTAIRDRIFDPFFTTKGTGQGAGIGLAVSQSVIGDHDGELTLETHTRGACFVVTLPASRALEVESHT